MWRTLTLFLAVLAGCTDPLDGIYDNAGSARSDDAIASRVISPSPSAPARITNRFGMTFCLVAVDSTRPDHKDTFPGRPYYLQATELTYEQFSAYREASAGSGLDHADHRKELRFPTEWRDVANLAAELSALDPDYDYLLPTRAQWAFACMNGYDQTCPGGGAKSTIDSTESNRPNKYGIDGFMNYDAECSDVPGLFLGKLDNWARAYDGREMPECRCDQFTTGNPDADDGLNELIVGRFVLIPESPSSMAGG